MDRAPGPQAPSLSSRGNDPLGSANAGDVCRSAASLNGLRLPWIWGACFFEWALIDAHPALNTGNWAYLAGVGSDPRSFGGGPSRFDLERQLRLYDPQETHRRRWS